MNGLRAAISVELLKSRRSRMPWALAVGFSMAPLVSGLFMLILKDPDRARQLGLLGQKAQLTAGSADWPTYLNMVGQAVAIGGGILFAFLAAWLFGREFADRTIRSLLATPTARGSIVVAKLLVLSAWSAAITAWVLALALAIGVAVDIPGGSGSDVGAWLVGAIVAALMTIALQTVTAFWASAGRGYMPPLGWAVVTIALSQILAVLGWGSVFPWSVPALVAGAGGEEAGTVGIVGLTAVLIAAIVGLVITIAWWRTADQSG
jgi:ABC-type transport system involved in multi-copper enzyme maturation permease subunit